MPHGRLQLLAAHRPAVQEGQGADQSSEAEEEAGARHGWEEEAGAEEEHRRGEELAAREGEVGEEPRPGQAEGAKEPNARAEEGREGQREEGEEEEPPAEQSVSEGEVQAGPAEVSGVRGSEGLASEEPGAQVELTGAVAEGARSVVSASSRLVHERAVLPEGASSVSLAVEEEGACSPVPEWEQPSESQSPVVSSWGAGRLTFSIPPCSLTNS